MTCRECDQFLHDYVAGELPAEVRETFERHLTVCRNCVKYLDQYRLTIRAGQKAFECGPDDAEPDIPEELIRAILAARKVIGPV
jgi:anti-sigma factor RsiW